MQFHGSHMHCKVTKPTNATCEGVEESKRTAFLTVNPRGEKLQQ